MNLLIKEYAEEALTAGFRVFIAESGNHGLFTDSLGTKVVSFDTEFGGINISGNFKTDRPFHHGTGWGMQGYYSPIEAFNQYAPSWAIGTSKWAYTTLAQYLKIYQSSSKYTELSKEV